MRKYHIVMVDGERDVTADRCYTEASGALVFMSLSGDNVLILAPNTWKYVEVERLDDK